MSTIRGGGASIPPLAANTVVVTNSSGNLANGDINVTQLGYLANVTSDIQDQLNATYALSTLAANTAVVTNAAGGLANGGATAAEIGYLSGASSNIQAQLNAKGTYTLPSLSANVVLVTNAASGLADGGASATELSYLAGATSNLQAQIDGKTNALAIMTANGDLLVTNAGVLDNLGVGTNNQILTVTNAAAPMPIGWAAPADQTIYPKLSIANVASNFAVTANASLSQWNVVSTISVTTSRANEVVEIAYVGDAAANTTSAGTLALGIQIADGTAYYIFSKAYPASASGQNFPINFSHPLVIAAASTFNVNLTACYFTANAVIYSNTGTTSLARFSVMQWD